MDEITIRIRRGKHAEGLPLPSYATPGSAGMDIFAAVRSETVVEPGEVVAVPTGLFLALPEGYELQIRPRSGLAVKHGISVINGPGTVDSDYRGEVKVLLVNHGRRAWAFRRGDRIAQGVVAPVVRGCWLEAGRLAGSRRGQGGFGHTGQGSSNGKKKKSRK